MRWLNLPKFSVYVHYSFVIIFSCRLYVKLCYTLFRYFFTKSNHFLLLQGVEEAGEGAVDVVGVSDQMVLCRLLPEC